MGKSSYALAVLLVAGSAVPSSLGQDLSLEPDTNRQGADYRDFDLASPEPGLCQAECAKDPNCLGFTYVKPGVQSPRPRCWLKSSSGLPSPNACCVSGAKRNQPGSMSASTNRQGLDYRDFDLASPSPALCQSECQADARCRAFTYVKPGLQGPKARCWLKSRVPPPSPDDCCVSGVKAMTYTVVEAAPVRPAAAPALASPVAPAVAIFNRMLPILQSDRCANCHGKVNPFAATHFNGTYVARRLPNGDLDTAQDWTQCQSCHDGARALARKTGQDPNALASQWRIPIGSSAWGGKSPAQICAAIVGRFDPDTLLDHMRTDVLVALGFQGEAGGARMIRQAYNSALPDREPPTSDGRVVTQDEFVTLVADWERAAGATSQWPRSLDAVCPK